MSVEAKFTAAVKVIKSLPSDGPYQPSNDTKLKFYSLYKQATEGQCSQARPAFWDVIGRVKWDHWKRLGDMSKDDAMQEYIEELKKIVETMSFSGDVQNFLDSIGPFYEFISLNSPEMDNIKELVEKATSSASCSSTSSESFSHSNSLPSSPETTPQTTPAKEVDEAAVEVPLITDASIGPKINHDHNYEHTNGHIPNQKLSHNNLNVTGNTPLGIIPPPSPMHKPLANGHAKRYSIEDIIQNDEKDEIIEIHANGGPKLRSRVNSQSSESDRYYSGDDFDMDELDRTIPTVTVSSPSFSNDLTKPGPSATVRKATKARSLASSMVPHGTLLDSQGNKIDAVTVLQSTVDRLNRDVDHVLARLRILEAAFASNPSGVANIAANENSGAGAKSRRTMKLSRMTWAIIFTWPIAVHLIFKLIAWWLNRRRQLSRRPLAILNSS
ncbi:unnamed protein product [Allacma fusca]|uniref:ACB domain-containing protein n=1 Tax=Allacma fusca TaxID=39272 RepID=A0A8J2KXT7_9HEXA|nr:unnamed protein product [Allacma fusca]